MKSLIIVAHPSSKGFSHTIAKTYARAKGDSEVIDLYSKDWKQDYLTYEDKRRIPYNDIQKRIQQKISQAEELVFVFPLWWASVPAILKNFIDQNFSAGFAFTYENGKPKGLLRGKTARIFTTCDAPKWIYALFLYPFFLTLKVFTLRFCGIHTKSATLFDRKRSRSEKDLEKWLKKVEKLAKE